MFTMLWFIFGPRLADAGVGWIWPWLDVEGTVWRISTIYPGIVGAILTLVRAMESASSLASTKHLSSFVASP